MYSLDVVEISRVQANQRAGRAGRTRPGKCYRLYPLAVYHDNLLEATVPEIQRSSLAGSVLYLKSLDLPDIDILKFDFLDAPSPAESLQDALKQLFLIDAIDANGTITNIGKTMAELPLEPSLARTLIEANKNDCLPQALTVAAMLSVEANTQTRRGSNLLQSFLMVPAGVIISSYFRSTSSGIKPTILLTGSKITTYRYGCFL